MNYRCKRCGGDASAEGASLIRFCEDGRVSCPGLSGAAIAASFIEDYGIHCASCFAEENNADASRGSWLASALMLSEQCGPDEDLAIIPNDGLAIAKKMAR